jgi:hypothetical protein
MFQSESELAYDPLPFIFAFSCYYITAKLTAMLLLPM